MPQRWTVRWGMYVWPGISELTMWYATLAAIAAHQTDIPLLHEDVIKWKHFSALLAICAGNPPVTGEFPSERPVTRSFDISLIIAWTNGWVSNRGAGDLRRHPIHYDVTVMELTQLSLVKLLSH